MLSITRMHEPWSMSWALATSCFSPTSAFQRVWGQQLPQFSHFHTLLRLRLTAPITASGFNSCHFSTNSLSLQIFFKTFSLYYFKHLMWFKSLYLQLPCDLHRNGLRTRVQCFKDHLLYRKTYFMKESVLFSACIMTQAAILVLGTGLMKLDVCIMRQGSPRIKIRQPWYFLVMWQQIISETRNLNIPLHCWKYTSWFGKQVKCRTNVFCILAHRQFIGNNELMTSLIYYCCSY